MIRPQYHFRWVGKDLHIWDVRALLEQSKSLPIIEVPLSEIKEIDEPYWFDHGGPPPTCRNVLAHVEQALETDLSFPILLCAEGRVMDGMHRVIKALHRNETSIRARKLIKTPPPDHKNKKPEELNYD